MNLRVFSTMLGLRKRPPSPRIHFRRKLLHFLSQHHASAVRTKKRRPKWCETPPPLFCFFFLSHTSTFQLPDKPWSPGRCRPSLPPGSCLHFLSRKGLNNPTARRFFVECLLTHALALSASQSVHKKKPPAGQRRFLCTYSAFIGGVEHCRIPFRSGAQNAKEKTTRVSSKYGGISNHRLLFTFRGYILRSIYFFRCY